MLDALEIFNWAKARGDAAIVDRIIIKILPELITSQIRLSKEEIANAEVLMVPEAIYAKIKQIAETLIDEDQKREASNV